MARKKNTIKSQLEELDREIIDETPLAPVAGTDYTGVQRLVQPGASFQAAYNAQRDLIDGAVANGPLFGGQTGAVGSAAKDRAMEQGLYPGVAQVQAPAAGVQPVEPVQGVNPVGEKVREDALSRGLYDTSLADTGAKVKERAMQEGLYPDVSAQNYSQELERERRWDDGLSFSPYAQRMQQLEGEAEQVQELDAELQRREDARKRIVALGDAFASFANLIGTAHGAENQRQTYASPLVADSVDRARAMRAGRMQQIKKNIDEQRDALIAYQLKNDPNYLPNQLEQQRIDVQRGNQKLQYDKLDWQKEHQGEQDALNRDKLAYQQEKDATKQAMDERKQDWKEHVDQVKLGQAASRIALSNRKYDDQVARNSGGSGSSKDWSDTALEDYAAFKNEAARNAGCDSWEDFVEASRTNAELRTFVNRVNEAKTPNAQRGILNDYAKDLAPEYFNRYHQGTARASGGTGGKKPNPMGPAEKKKKPNPMN